MLNAAMRAGSSGRDRKAQALALHEPGSERRIRSFGAQRDFAADEFQILIAQKRSGEEPGFNENLEAVADAENETALRGELRVAQNVAHQRDP